VRRILCVQYRKYLLFTHDERPQGPLGALPGVIGSIQAIEAIKYLLGIGNLLTDALLTFDALAMSFRKVTVRRNAGCTLCG
jgi:molybdopterin/thiamine biosynthesis adenylyltransferase